MRLSLLRAGGSCGLQPCRHNFRAPAGRKLVQAFAELAAGLVKKERPGSPRPIRTRINVCVVAAQ